MRVDFGAQRFIVMKFSLIKTLHEDFAKLSGDYNPIHMDENEARLTSYGFNIAHGVNVALMALETCLLSEYFYPEDFHLASAKFKFLKPVYVGDELKVLFDNNMSREASISVVSNEVEVIRIRLAKRKAEPLIPLYLDPENSVRPRIREPSEYDVRLAGDFEKNLSLEVDASLMRSMFSRCVGWLGEVAIASIIQLSTIVGMEWPGKNSLLSEIKVTFTDNPLMRGRLRVQARSTNAEFGITQISITGSSIKATVYAFFRPKRVDQIASAELQGKVPSDKFVNQKALIVGGSRGIGEVCAKILAAGGADVTITYRASAESVLEMVEEIRRFGGTANACELDVTDIASLESNAKRWSDLTHLYYFASPPIFVRRDSQFNTGLLDTFMNFYVINFSRVVCEASKLTGRLRVFYPSTIAINEGSADLLEYSIAKEAGEIAAAKLSAALDNVTVSIARLPRILTDQTNTIVYAESQDATTVMLPILIELNG